MRGKEDLSLFRPVAAIDSLSLDSTSHAWRQLKRRLTQPNKAPVTPVDAAVLKECLEQQRRFEARNTAVGLGVGLLASLGFRGLPIGHARLMSLVMVGSCTASGLVAGAIMGSKKTLSRLALLQTPLGASVRGELFVRLAPDEHTAAARLHADVVAALARQRASRWGVTSAEFAPDDANSLQEDEQLTGTSALQSVAELMRSSSVWGDRVFG
ncbi:hypothetical protein KFE25_003276 [Diacronema lutheri]|uniref:Uncharacterized protein n=1 Tax=Diacronema lutheri TaxID=2081491 RepID=A0A8J6CE60_DIALT|nr:hypothetical protein KFE25_003276 [Diacronema lutheri]|mmetsp:Transcript_3520/g.11024  ORF Transcript_3520/g.11024 Transcript_3520/m.11024 type:complete len:212 (-) Transcript_3520:204-839(-)